MNINMIVVKLPGGDEIKIPEEIEEFFRHVMDRTEEVASSTALVTLLANQAYDTFETSVEGLDTHIKSYLKGNLELLIRDESIFWARMVFTIRDYIQNNLREQRKQESNNGT